MSSSHAVKRPRIVVKNFPLELRRHILAHVDGIDELILARRIAVRIVRADEQMIIAGVFRQIRNILIGFARDVEAILAKQLCALAETKFVLLQAPHDVNQKRHPASRRLDEAEAELGKLFGNLIGDEVAEGEQRHHPSVAEGVIPR